MSTIASVHRFHDCVAVYLANGRTVYLRPAEAGALAKALCECARDIKKNEYSRSQFKMADIPLVDTGHNGTAYEHKRK